MQISAYTQCYKAFPPKNKTKQENKQIKTACKEFNKHVVELKDACLTSVLFCFRSCRISSNSSYSFLSPDIDNYFCRKHTTDIIYLFACLFEPQTIICIIILFFLNNIYQPVLFFCASVYSIYFNSTCLSTNIHYSSIHIPPLYAGMFVYINTPKKKKKSQTAQPFLVWCGLDHLHMNSAQRPLESVCRPCLSIATVQWVSKISNYLPEVREQVPSTNPRIGLSPINLHSADDRYEKGKESLMPAPDLQRSINLVIRSANNNCQRRGGERRGGSAA